MMPSIRLPITTLVLPLLLATAATLTMSGCKDESAADPASKDGAKAKAEETPEQKAQREDGFGAKLANNFISCYAKFEINGAVDGRLTMAVGSDGAVAYVSYQGSAADPVQQCLLDLIRPRSLDGYEGEPGIAQFTYSGTYSGGIEMLSESWAFKRRSALPPEAQASLDASLGAVAADEPAAAVEEPAAEPE